MDAAVAQALAQVRKWQSSPDNGWAPSREQCGVLADAVERLCAIEQRAGEVAEQGGDVGATVARYIRDGG